MPLYLYALQEEGAAPGGLAGVGGAAVQLVPAAGLVAAISIVAQAPRPDAAALAAHDAVVRRLMAAADAVLPMRFGQTAPGAVELEERLRPRAAVLRAALARVAGCEQWNVRLLRPPAADPTRPAATDEGAAGPGTRFLRARARAAHVAELRALRDSVGSLARVERVEPAPPGRPFAATVYHLVRRHDGQDWERSVAAAAPHVAPLRLAVSGPHPPYAFAGREVLS